MHHEALQEELRIAANPRTLSRRSHSTNLPAQPQCLPARCFCGSRFQTRFPSAPHSGFRSSLSKGNPILRTVPPLTLFFFVSVVLGARPRTICRCKRLCATVAPLFVYPQPIAGIDRRDAVESTRRRAQSRHVVEEIVQNFLVRPEPSIMRALILCKIWHLNRRQVGKARHAHAAPK
jgi:hypothetical protein